MPDSLAVVSSRFCAEAEVQLRIKERSSWPGRALDVFEAASSKRCFKVKARASSLADEGEMEDLAGNVVGRVRRPSQNTSRVFVHGPNYSFQVGHESFQARCNTCTDLDRVF